MRFKGEGPYQEFGMFLFEGEVFWRGWNVSERRGGYLGAAIFPPEQGYLQTGIFLVRGGLASMSLIRKEFGIFLVGDVTCGL